MQAVLVGRASPWPWPDASAVAVFGDQPAALLGWATSLGGDWCRTQAPESAGNSTNFGRHAAFRVHGEHKAAHWKNYDPKQIRNIAIIAHVDHGKTTMVDQLLRQSGTFADHEKVVDTVMDNNAIEKRARHHHPGQELRRELEGHAHQHRGHPGHADFGGEVERALSMVDGVVLLIDAVRRPRCPRRVS